MAYFEDLHEGQWTYLQSNHLIGRDQDRVDTCIERAEISRLHAQISWHDSSWYLKDISSNGCWLNGKRVNTGELYLLNIGDQLHFAGLDGFGVVIKDLSPPSNLLIPIDAQGKPMTEEVLSLENYHLLPNEQAPELALYFASDKGWCAEPCQQNGNTAVKVQYLTDGDTVRCGLMNYQLFFPRSGSDTQLLPSQQLQLTDLDLRFDLSLDEESVELQVDCRGELSKLGIRSHHEVLMQLVRYRAKDQNEGMAENEQGWVYPELLVRDLGIELNHLNIWIFRIRKQFVSAFPTLLDAQEVCQRRAGRVRLGNVKAKIIKAEQLECEVQSKVE